MGFPENKAGDGIKVQDYRKPATVLMQKSGQIDAALPIQSPKCKKPGQTTGLLQYLKRRGLKAAAGEYRSGNQELITLLALDPFWRLAAARPGITRNWVCLLYTSPSPRDS